MNINYQKPKWLKEELKKSTTLVYKQIELKYILPEDVWHKMKPQNQLSTKYIEQIYLDKYVVSDFENILGLHKNIEYKEYRVRRVKDDIIFTAKSDFSQQGTQRQTINKTISEDLYLQLIQRQSKNKRLKAIKKTRFSFNIMFAREKISIDVDSYHETSGKQIKIDYLICELKVPNSDIANILLKRNFYSKNLLFLKQSIQITGYKHFSNQYLSEFGFVEKKYDNLLIWLKKQNIDTIVNSCSSIDYEMIDQKIVTIEKAIENIKYIKKEDLSNEEIFYIQDIFKEMAFTFHNSKGRKHESNPMIRALDKSGRGWVRDYHEIISANPFIRLNSKPQIFRPGIGYTNTTTRGAHTSDVVATSFQLAKQLGLNADLCIAAAALHDLGHAPGGHIGEELLFKLSGRRFQHHIFSLSLSEIFDMNLLYEVMSCALYHKSGGKKLKAEEGFPQEYGIVRIADKISYCPWDLFDSINNGFISIKDIDPFIIDTLGNNPIQWLWSLIQAIIKESAEAHNVQFTEASGDIFKAYKQTRSIVYEKIHKTIQWTTLKAQIEMVYEKIALSFPDIDPVVIVAYITDQELAKLSNLIESEPINKSLKLSDLNKFGFGFTEIIDIIRKKSSISDIIYYS